MAATDPTDALNVSWRQLEEAVHRLHTAARAPISRHEFYQQLAREAAAALSARSAAVWSGEPPSEVTRTAFDQADENTSPPRLSDGLRHALTDAYRSQTATFSTVRFEGSPAPVDGAALRRLLCPIMAPAAVGVPPRAVAIVELVFDGQADARADEGRLEFVETLADVARDFEAYDRLRTLAGDADDSFAYANLMQRLASATNLQQGAFQLANEGRRLLDCDRLTVLVRRGRRWNIAAVSGVDRLQPRSAFARGLCKLADRIARWGEPFVFAAGSPTTLASEPRMPPQLAEAIEEHVDAASTRSLAAAPYQFSPRPEFDDAEASRRDRTEEAKMVLVAECFDADLPQQLPRQLSELGELCAPALASTAALDRFPVRPLLRVANGLSYASESLGLGRLAVVLAATVAVVVALILAPVEWEVEAPAVLTPAHQREVFASTTGAVREVFVHHGQMVTEGEPLAVLHDPELLLQLQQVRGELDAADERLDAINISRTDRRGSGDERSGQLPLSSEEQLLRQRLANLKRQLALLQSRQESLTLRSPISGQVLTRDVQSLLESRPVQRGQVVLTVADVDAEWELSADVSQRHIGRVLQAREQGEPLDVRFRLAGDLSESRLGRVAKIDARAVLTADGLFEEPPPVKVRISIEEPLPEAARPGMGAAVRICCGKKPFGYVWLYDVGATIYRWWTF